MLKIILLVCLLYVPAFAYLDPGSGSLLLSSMVAIFASVVFFIKNLFYKLASPSTLLSGGFSLSTLRGGGNNTHLKASIVFYSEGKQYYFTFKPILDALDSLKHPYIYYTSGLDDPALKRTDKSDNYGTFAYIGTGNKAYVKLNTLHADICVLTTPGLDVLQIKRSRGVKHYCHIVHSLTPMTYRAFGVDYFDSVLVANEIQRDFVREVERAHNVKYKYIGVVGSTYLDELASLRNSSLKGHSVLSDKSGNLHSDFQSFASSKLPQSSLDNPLFSSQSLECDTSLKHTDLKPQAIMHNPRISESSNLKSKLTQVSTHTNSNSKILSEKSGLCSFERGDKTRASIDEAKNKLPDLSPKRSFFRKAELPKENTLEQITILVSPSWGKETLLSKYGLKLLEPLAQSGFHIIIRPHPQSLIGETESSNIATLQNVLKSYENVEWDIGTPNVYAFARADMMISDFSSVIFDFVCLEGKPVLTLDFSFDSAGYDLSDIDMEHFYTFEALKRIGGKLQRRDFSNIAEIITQVLESSNAQEAQKCKEELWRYPHKAGLCAANELLKIERELLEHSMKAYISQVRRIIELDSMLKHSVLSDKSGNLRLELGHYSQGNSLHSSLDNPLLPTGISSLRSSISSQSLECDNKNSFLDNSSLTQDARIAESNDLDSHTESKAHTQSNSNISDETINHKPMPKKDNQ